MSRCFWLLVTVAAAFFITASSARIAAQQGARQQPAPGLAEGLQFLPVRGNIYVLQGAGANITVSIGRDG
ncbi:MAG TPA: hypothetical protein VFS23_22180, partial [Vicinamibacterales bacterium]|nr:hypothetical protein [Vicinamibacterales bacterium]